MVGDGRHSFFELWSLFGKTGAHWVGILYNLIHYQERSVHGRTFPPVFSSVLCWRGPAGVGVAGVKNAVLGGRGIDGGEQVVNTRVCSSSAMVPLSLFSLFLVVGFIAGVLLIPPHDITWVLRSQMVVESSCSTCHLGRSLLV